MSIADDRDGKSKESSGIDPEYPSQDEVEEIDEERRKPDKSKGKKLPGDKARVHESGSVQRD